MKAEDDNVHEFGTSADDYANSWALLVEKSYQGAMEFYRVI